MNVFFDLDGTLTDPDPGITRCIEHALVSLGRPAPDAERGYGSEEELRAAAADSIVASMPELCEQIERKQKESGLE